MEVALVFRVVRGEENDIILGNGVMYRWVRECDVIHTRNNLLWIFFL